ncbi:phosphatases II [Ramicandelaber brevisporus]|nr:phosphatases II [Ramicandelaber brevisporus]
MRNLSSNLKKHASMLSINTKTDATTAAELPLRSASANSTFSGNGVSGLVSIRNGIRILRADQHQPMYADGPVEIMAGLYLGDQLNAENRQQLARFGISYILNVAEEVNNPYDGSKKQKRKASGSIEMSAYSDDSSPSPSPGYGSPLMCASPVSSECESTTSMMSAASSPSPSPSTNSGINSDSDSDSDSITYKKLSLSHHQEDLISFINEAFDYIDAARQSGATVLVHCQLGVSRSASMVVAYVMRSQKMTYEQAYAFVKGKSPCISPNTFLIFQLCEYEKTLGIAKAPTSDNCSSNGHSTSSNGSSSHVSRSKSAHGVITSMLVVCRHLHRPAPWSLTKACCCNAGRIRKDTELIQAMEFPAGQWLLQFKTNLP